ncbi:copper resistance CopC family protein [Herbidospora mongoliensis]|uniref:copper resistance CopC family protein n=1 Tax=Herbidospora mongoliensis TaxID=688067 RepID=UPI001C3F4586|nr:copper resistance CopC family protein [Herbidospora mongoliensis]
MRSLTVCLVLLASLLWPLSTPGPASAHNVLKTSDPADGASVSRLDRVTLTFDQPVRADFAKLALTGPDGARYDAGLTVRDEVVTATVKPLVSPGMYVIGWQIVSNDGHPVSGTIRFTYTNAGTGTPTGAAATLAPAPGSVSAPIPAASGGSWVWGLLIFALLMLSLATWVLHRHGARPHSARPSAPARDRTTA